MKKKLHTIPFLWFRAKHSLKYYFVSFQSPNNKGKFIYKYTTLLLYLRHLNWVGKSWQVKILVHRENKTKLTYCCLSRSCFCLGESHMIPSPLKKLYPSFLHFLNYFKPWLNFLFNSYLLPCSRNGSQTSWKQMILLFITPKSFLCYFISKISSFEFYHQWHKTCLTPLSLTCS